MKKIYSVFVVLICFISFLSGQENASFIEIDNSIDVEEKVLSFFYDYFDQYSLNIINHNQRIIEDELKPNFASLKYYDRQLYATPFFSDDDFYVINKITIKEKTDDFNIDEFYKRNGVISFEIYKISFFIKSSYNKYGEIFKEPRLKVIEDSIELFRYEDKVLISMLGDSINYNWVLSSYEDLLVEKLKKGEINVINTEDENHYTERN